MPDSARAAASRVRCGILPTFMRHSFREYPKLPGLQSRGLLRWHPIKALLIRKRFHSSSKGTAASLGESQDRRDIQVDAAAGEGGGLPPLRRPRATPAQLPGRRLRVRVQCRRSEGFFKPCACLQPPGYRRVPPRRTVAQSFTLRRRAKHPLGAPAAGLRRSHHRLGPGLPELALSTRAWR